jgi:ATP-dependent RNA helicase RhlE
MFSATMPPEIRRLAAEWLRDPARIEVAPTAATADLVQQSVFHIEPKQKPLLLVDYLQNTPSSRTLVFSRTKHGADKIVRHLMREGIEAAAIHGNKSQNNRQRVLKQFKSNSPPVLVATDVASRGLDIDEISHVINYDLPLDPETYVHRIGRTGRAGATGEAISFCGRDERGLLNSIERLLRRSIRVAQPRVEVRQALASVGQASKQPGGKSNQGSGQASRPKPTTSAQGSSNQAEQSRRKFWRSKRKKRANGSTAPVAAPAGQGNRPGKPGKHRRRFSQARA